jgi:hypothetical protein
MSDKKGKYQPPYTITPAVVNLIAQISEAIGRLTMATDAAKTLRLRRIRRSCASMRPRHTGHPCP